jgi:hypothetical protein
MDSRSGALDNIETFAEGLDHPEGITITRDGFTIRPSSRSVAES